MTPFLKKNKDIAFSVGMGKVFENYDRMSIIGCSALCEYQGMCVVGLWLCFGQFPLCKFSFALEETAFSGVL